MRQATDALHIHLWNSHFILSVESIFVGLYMCVCVLKVVTKHNVLLFESLFTVCILNVFVFKPSN